MCFSLECPVLLPPFFIYLFTSSLQEQPLCVELSLQMLDMEFHQVILVHYFS